VRSNVIMIICEPSKIGASLGLVHGVGRAIPEFGELSIIMIACIIAILIVLYKLFNRFKK